MAKTNDTSKPPFVSSRAVATTTTPPSFSRPAEADYLHSTATNTPHNDNRGRRGYCGKRLHAHLWGRHQWTHGRDRRCLSERFVVVRTVVLTSEVLSCWPPLPLVRSRRQGARRSVSTDHHDSNCSFLPQHPCFQLYPQQSFRKLCKAASASSPLQQTSPCLTVCSPPSFTKKPSRRTEAR